MMICLIFSWKNEEDNELLKSTISMIFVGDEEMIQVIEKIDSTIIASRSDKMYIRNWLKEAKARTSLSCLKR